MLARVTGGYCKRILHVSLDTGRHCVEEIPEEVLRDHLGGRGLGVWLLHRLARPGLDPLSPSNPLVFSTGPLTGTAFPTSSRVVLTTKGPLTGIYLYSVAGGGFGRSLKKAGFDCLVVTGIAPEQSVLIIRDDQVSVRPSPELKDMEVSPTLRTVNNAHGEDLSFIAIGPAGERKVRFASVMTDDHRSFGRGGGGAVMGSKNLKAIGVAGQMRVGPVDREGFVAGLRGIMKDITENPGPRKDFPRYGTADGPELLSGWGILPTRNWTHGTFPDAWRISMPYLREGGGFVRRDVGCPSCPIKCAKEMRVESGEFAGAWDIGPEYETLYALGSNLGIGIPEFVIHANHRCDELGLDTISTGVTIGFAMECFESGVLSADDTGGLDLRFGNHRAAAVLLEEIAMRRGIGDILAEGTRRAARGLGKGTDHFAVQCKGLELGGYDPRGALSQAVVYAAGNRGGCHHALGLAARWELNTGTPLSSVDVGVVIRDLARERILLDSLPACTFAIQPKRHLSLVAKVLEALTGWKWDPEDLLSMGDRVNTLERSFNRREGYTAAHDTLPERLFRDPLPDGPARGKVVPEGQFRKMLRDYYKAMGWDEETGTPRGLNT